ncbi:hypothetical protein CBR_g66762 [Chara braunii]|uniref:PROP1-like PPR domain-containing protein n=1 Tax=Chara braunii TaxID=69332 RepID=A0A388K9C5_CHABU|nr:hypothetical protein CBR_g66762 [Chara braunii]|eukprot:GBG66626.1 hypothetical protein CBR_g66762 [Chara braunii]
MDVTAGLRVVLHRGTATASPLSRGGGCLAASATTPITTSSPSCSSATGMKIQQGVGNSSLPTTGFGNRRKDQVGFCHGLVLRPYHSSPCNRGGEKMKSLTTTASALPSGPEVAAMAVAAAVAVPVCWLYFARTGKGHSEPTTSTPSVAPSTHMLAASSAVAGGNANANVLNRITDKVDGREERAMAGKRTEVLALSANMDSSSSSSHHHHSATVGSLSTEPTVSAAYVAVAEGGDTCSSPLCATWLTLGQNSAQDLSLVDAAGEVRTHVVTHTVDAATDLHVAVQGTLASFVGDGRPVLLEAWISELEGEGTTPSPSDGAVSNPAADGVHAGKGVDFDFPQQEEQEDEAEGNGEEEETASSSPSSLSLFSSQLSSPSTSRSSSPSHSDFADQGHVAGQGQGQGHAIEGSNWHSPNGGLAEHYDGIMSPNDRPLNQPVAVNGKRVVVNGFQVDVSRDEHGVGRVMAEEEEDTTSSEFSSGTSTTGRPVADHILDSGVGSILENADDSGELSSSARRGEEEGARGQRGNMTRSASVSLPDAGSRATAEEQRSSHLDEEGRWVSGSREGELKEELGEEEERQAGRRGHRAEEGEGEREGTSTAREEGTQSYRVDGRQKQEKNGKTTTLRTANDSDDGHVQEEGRAKQATRTPTGTRIRTRTAGNELPMMEVTSSSSSSSKVMDAEIDAPVINTKDDDDAGVPTSSSSSSSDAYSGPALPSSSQSSMPDSASLARGVVVASTLVEHRVWSVDARQSGRGMEATVGVVYDEEEKLEDYNRLRKKGRLTEAVAVLEEIRREAPDSVVFTNISVQGGNRKVSHKAFLLECKKKKAVSEALRFVRLLKKPPLQVFSLALSVCAAAADVDNALKVFADAVRAEHRPDCILYTALISTCAKAGRLELAFKIYHEMEGAGLDPNVKTYGALIDGCARAGQMTKAFGVYGIIQTKGLNPDRVVFNTLINACSRAGAVDRAFEVHEDMKVAGIEANAVTLGTLMDACARVGDLQRALQVYKWMRQGGERMRATCRAFTTAVHACSASGDLRQALSIYNDMKRAGVRPDQVFFSALIDVAGHAGELDVAFGFLEDMQRMGLQADAVVNSALMGVCARAARGEGGEGGEVGRERGLALYAKLKADGVTCSTSTFNSLIKLHGTAGNLDMAVATLEEMRASGVQPNQITYDLLLSACARQGEADRAFALYAAARSEGIRPFLSACADLISLTLMQIRKGAPPPKSGTFSLGQTSWDASEKPAHQQWAARSLAVYRETLAAGVTPTKPVLSMLMGCVKIPDSPYCATWGLSEGMLGDTPADQQRYYALNGFPTISTPETSTAHRINKRSNRRNRPAQGSSGGDGLGLYDRKAVSLYEEAAAMGLVPQFSCLTGSIVVDMTDMPAHLAEVCVLALLKSCRRRRTSGLDSGGVKTVTLQLAVENRSSVVGGKNTTVRIAGRSAQAVTALLRKLHLSFQGSASTGTIRLNGGTIMRWLDPNKDQVRSAAGYQVPGFRAYDPGNPYTRLAKSITDQQRAIRLGEIPPYSPEVDFLGGGNVKTGRGRGGWESLKSRSYRGMSKKRAPPPSRHTWSDGEAERRISDLWKNGPSDDEDTDRYDSGYWSH